MHPAHQGFLTIMHYRNSRNHSLKMPFVWADSGAGQGTTDQIGGAQWRRRANMIDRSVRWRCDLSLPLLQQLTVIATSFRYAHRASTIAQLSFLDFVMNRFLMKLFITSNMEIVTYYREQFNFDLPSVILARHTSLFLDKLRRCDSYLNKDITACPKKVSPLTFCNNNRNSVPISITFYTHKTSSVTNITTQFHINPP